MKHSDGRPKKNIDAISLQILGAGAIMNIVKEMYQETVLLIFIKIQ